MLFNSFAFLVFFPLVTILYFLIPHTYRWLHLLAASCIFYMWFIPSYIFVLFFLILIDYTAAIYIEKTQGSKKKSFLILSLTATCLVLFVFKYYHFFISNLNSLSTYFGFHLKTWELNILLPVGLSFHTFQSLSYVIEVYRGHIKAEKHLGIYALYVMFYPQLVAGPIERPQNLLPQIYEKHIFDYERMVSGLRLMTWGFFKKMVVADRVGIITDRIHMTPHLQSGPVLCFSAFLFGVQLYCDFSGYSDIAIGAARVMGFRLSKNFDRAFFAKSSSELWRRYHITLMSWFRDYVYIPLSGDRNNKGFLAQIRQSLALFFTFLLSGLWHGANWTFIIWSGLNALFILFGRWTKPIRKPIGLWLEKTFLSPLLPALRNIWTIGLLCYAAIFFRADSLDRGLIYFKGTGLNWNQWPHLMNPQDSFTNWRVQFDPSYNISFLWLMATFTSILLFFTVDWLNGKEGGVTRIFQNLPSSARVLCYYTLIFIILFWGVYGERQFVYFQF